MGQFVSGSGFEDKVYQESYMADIFQSRWNDCRIPASLDHRDSRPQSPGRGETVGRQPRFSTSVPCA